MEKEELIETVKALTDLCLSAHAVIAAQAVKIDALTACTVLHRPNEVPSLRDAMLQAAALEQNSIEQEKRRVFQSQIAQSLSLIDRLAAG